MNPHTDSIPSAPNQVGTARTRLGRLRHNSSLFWRTFALIAALILVSQLILLQTFGFITEAAEPERNLERMVDVVGKIRAIKSSYPPSEADRKFKELEAIANLHISPRRKTDHVVLPENDALLEMIQAHLIETLGDGTFVAVEVNQHKGLWLAFTADGEDCWVHLEATWGSLTQHNLYLFWGLVIASTSLIGSAILARYINRPIRDLKLATRRFEAGDFQGSRLDESVPSPEVRAVNQGFNRMATQLARAEQDKAVMLAGISHDLRTPLSRLRLDIELSVADEHSRSNMIADLEQMNNIIGKFMDYARSPNQTEVEPVSLLLCLEQCFTRISSSDREFMEIAHELTPEHIVMADPIELQRIIDNLLENALRYGRSADNRAYIGITIKSDSVYWIIEWRDFGKGVPPELLDQLTEPFFRADLARTYATGAGLGLTITEMAIRRMGGELLLANAPEGGLITTIKLRRAT
jgi:two-component system, OmpR family, osmolarity sensor histidine kinase EnvZ